MNRLHISGLIGGLLLTVAASQAANATMPANQDIFLQCEGELRSRMLAFKMDELVTEERRDADRKIQIKIRNAKRATIMEHPSDKVLFSPGHCRVSPMKISCEMNNDTSMRQMFISRTSGDAIFEGYTESSDEKSALVVEHYSCIKEDRQPLF